MFEPDRRGRVDDEQRPGRELQYPKPCGPPPDSDPTTRAGYLPVGKMSAGHSGSGARAQGPFDCWIEQKEENHQPKHIAACREAFWQAMDDIEVAMAPPPPPPPAPVAVPQPPAVEAPEPLVLYFAFDSDALTSDSMMVVERALEIIPNIGATDLAVTGHADRAGPAEYNLTLSLRRANAVSEALVARGAIADRISVAGRGEEDLAVATDDDMPEPANRRVEIILLR